MLTYIGLRFVITPPAPNSQGKCQSRTGQVIVKNFSLFLLRQSFANELSPIKLELLKIKLSMRNKNK